MEMTKSYLNGKIDSMTYSLDFPHEVEARYKSLLKEDREIAEIIYDCLVEDGVYLYDNLTEGKFKEKITNEYEYIKDIYEGNAEII